MYFVTGATGFVGKALVKELSKNNKVRILSRKTSNLDGLDSPNVEIIYGDINNKKTLEKATKGVDAVVHLAFSRRGTNLAEMNKVNVRGTKTLFEACEENKVRHFVLFSSVTVYGESLGVHENSPFEPYDNYGASKVNVENLINSMKSKSNIVVTTLRPSYIYGPGDPHSIFQIIKAIKKKRFALFGKGYNLMNLIYIDDIVNITLKILNDKKIQGRDYIISDTKPYTLSEISSVISEVLATSKPRKIPYFIGYSIGACFDIISNVTRKKLPLSKSRVKNMTRNRSFRTDRSRKEIQYTPQTQLREGIEKTVVWGQEHSLL